MRNGLRYALVILLSVVAGLEAGAQIDRREVRSGNRHFKKGEWAKSEIDYRKALLKDTASFAANYNLANSLYRQDNFEEAGKSLDKLKEVAGENPGGADYFYNLGNVAVKKKDWAGAVEAYKQSLLLRPEDMDAKENYAYAKLMLQKDGGGGGGSDNQDQNQDQDQNQNQNQNQDQNQDQDQDQNQDQNQNQNQNQNQDQQDQGQGQGDAKISPQQAQQMLKAIQAREKETQDKVNKEKAAVLKSRQKEKNW